MQISISELYDMQSKKGTHSCCFGNYIISLMW